MTSAPITKVAAIVNFYGRWITPSLPLGAATIRSGSI
jgi:hypothetical protein